MVYGPGDADGVDRGHDQEQDDHGQQDGLVAHDDLHLADGAVGLAFDDLVVLPIPYADVPPCLQVSVVGSMGLHVVSSLRSIDNGKSSPRKEDL